MDRLSQQQHGFSAFGSGDLANRRGKNAKESEDASMAAIADAAKTPPRSQKTGPSFVPGQKYLTGTRQHFYLKAPDFSQRFDPTTQRMISRSPHAVPLEPGQQIQILDTSSHSSFMQIKVLPDGPIGWISNKDDNGLISTSKSLGGDMSDDGGFSEDDMEVTGQVTTAASGSNKGKHGALSPEEAAAQLFGSTGARGIVPGDFGASGQLGPTGQRGGPGSLDASSQLGVAAAATTNRTVTLAQLASDTNIQNYGGITHYTDAHGSTYTWERNMDNPTILYSITAKINPGSIVRKQPIAASAAGPQPRSSSAGSQTNPKERAKLLKVKVGKGSGYSAGHGIAAVLGGVNHPVNGYPQATLQNQALGIIENFLAHQLEARGKPLDIFIDFEEGRGSTPDDVLYYASMDGSNLLSHRVLEGLSNRRIGGRKPFDGYTRRDAHMFTVRIERDGDGTAFLLLENNVK